MKIPKWVKILFAVSLGIGFVIYWQFFMMHPFPLPKLVRNLPPVLTEEANRAFDTRVRNKFLQTVKESELIDELQKESFTIIDGTDELGWKRAILKGGQFPCALRWDVLWRTDDHGIVSEINGKYGEAGCL